MRKMCHSAPTLSQAGDTLSGPYLMITGCTGAPARKAPVLNGRMHFPFDVVPCKRAAHERDSRRSRPGNQAVLQKTDLDDSAYEQNPASWLCDA